MSMFKIATGQLTPSQCAMIAASKAIEYQKIEGRSGTRTDLGYAPKSGSITMRSSQVAAIEYGLSRTTVEFGIAVIKNGIPALIELVNQGKISVSLAAKAAQLSPEKQKQIIQMPKKKLINFLKCHTSTNQTKSTIYINLNL